jgi:peptidyl-prolyl cis-trans isomerase D
MLETIRGLSQGWLAKLILALITVPFALWGIESYFRSDADADIVAKVSGQSISQQEFNQSIREQSERLRNALGRNYDPALMDKPDMRQGILDNLINQRLLFNEAVRARLVVPDAQLAEVISAETAFQLGGKFSQEHYEKLLRAQNLTPVAFEGRLRRDLLVQQLRNAYLESAIVPQSAIEGFIKINEEQREVSQVTLSPDQYLGNIQVDAAALKSYYDGHQKEFTVPEQIRLNYVVLSMDNLMAQVQVSDEEVKKQYEEQAARYQDQGERQASHILLTLPPNANASAKEAAKRKAEQILEQVKKNPASFAEVAKKESQDTGSAPKGGDLGMFARGAMVKQFEDAAFQMKVGEIRGPVESEFGFHIIKLTGSKPGKTITLAEVKPSIVNDIKQQKAGSKFAEAAESFSNMVYEQSDSLKPVSDALKLTMQTSDWLSHNGGPTVPLNNPKLLQAVFADDVLKNARNTEAIEVAPNTLVAARIVEHKPASVKPFEQVGAEITARLQREQASAKAVSEAKDKLAKLQQGTNVDLSWGKAQMVSRQQAQNLNGPALALVFKANFAKLPAYVGLENAQGGYTLYKISKVTAPAQVDPAKRNEYANNMRQLVAEESFSAYLAYLRRTSDVTVKRENLEKKDR